MIPSGRRSRHSTFNRFRDYTCKEYAYIWADGVYFNVRLEDPGNSRQCILLLMGATAEGKKELIAVADGYRESERSWRELLLGLRARGLTLAPQLAVGDGALGFLEGPSEDLPDDAGPALLVPQDRQRAEQDAEVDPGESQVDAP